MTLIRYKNFGLALCKKYSIDDRTIDFDAMYDTAISYDENKSGLERYIKLLARDLTIDIRKSEPPPIERTIYYEENTDVENIYKPLYMDIEKLCKGFSVMLMVKGRAGTGKTYHIKNALALNKAEFTVIKDTTLAYLPQILYENNGKILWFQDCAYKFLRGVDSIEILKAITESDPKDRIVNNYNYNPLKGDIPREFIFTGKIIMDFNKIVDMRYLENYQALISRADMVELVFSNKEMAAIMRKVAKKGTESDITEFLIANFDEIGQNSFNLRTQTQAFADYAFCKSAGYDWKAYILERISNNRSPVFQMLYQFMGKEPKRTTELKKWLIANQNMTIRSAERRIKEFVEIGELYNLEPFRERDYLVSLFNNEFNYKTQTGEATLTSDATKGGMV